MIGRIRGTLIEKQPPTICVDVGGVGYEIDVPMSTLYQMPELGAQVNLFTHLAIREDAHVLFGFSSLNERSTFKALIKVTGIGARTALSLLSGMSAEELADAITRQETSRLVKIPGIGKKTAERLLLELRGKLGADLGGGGAVSAVHNSRDDVLHALEALGYSNKEASIAVKALPDDIDVSEGIKQALKSLSRA
ncbi:MAG: Holliday junction branch migration protein RuvA [Alcaligenes faecalis]|jgi:Holliday junction DNA helicase RuvA|uniref:Holliday junction branch migration complex subunit RuvA n=1 Tax=Alcaligenes faecalis TaxID=511 RepID=A0AB33D3T9_ALCFA|nr:Holliday junction branch migration protein RuvA [Alcaligenes faecalis]ASR90552.1 Holliday junction branch migration protein RuvA [Alcaligenes faecalis]MCH4225795.1 Holliday junction branch migration protein RuvA [Alcaligenes faecalis]